MMTRRLLIVALAAAALSACGRKGRPTIPEGSKFPRPYPDIQFPQDKTPEDAQDQ